MVETKSYKAVRKEQLKVILSDFNLQMLEAVSSLVSGSPFPQTNHIIQRIAHQLTSTLSKI